MSRTPTPLRCEPPEGMRDKPGLHWLKRKGQSYHQPVHWEPDSLFWADRSGVWLFPLNCRVEWAMERGWTYDSPVTPPAEVKALRAEIERLRGALTEISKQKLTGEISKADQPFHEWEEGYDSCVRIARAALAHAPEDTL